ncbi:MAG: hypothetical protein J3K34DRAFT_400785 [Monoraphidium minutum]|nr:MAG: hypothetical protein J3K34DRAFT_400785 [Monoraphidium minutum]
MLTHSALDAPMVVLALMVTAHLLALKAPDTWVVLFLVAVGSMDQNAFLKTARPLLSEEQDVPAVNSMTSGLKGFAGATGVTQQSPAPKPLSAHDFAGRLALAVRRAASEMSKQKRLNWVILVPLVTKYEDSAPKAMEKGVFSMASWVWVHLGAADAAWKQSATRAARTSQQAPAGFTMAHWHVGCGWYTAVAGLVGAERVG